MMKKKKVLFSIAAAVLLILLALSIAFVIFWAAIPHRGKLVPTDIDIPKLEKEYYDGEFSAEFRRAQKLRLQKQFIAAREVLRPVVEKLLDKDAQEADAAVVYFAYFDLLLSHLSWSWPDCILLGRVREKYPNEYRWALFHIRNSPALAQKDGHLQTPGDQKVHVSAPQLLDRMSIIGDLRKRHHDDKALVEKLDLFECYLYLYLWRLKNGDKPDDAKGEYEREEALKIAKRYRKHTDFNAAREYIIRQMLRDGTRGYYVFDGKKYFREKHLRKALRELEREAGENGVK